MGDSSVTQTLRRNTKGLNGFSDHSKFSDRSVHLLNTFRQIWSRKELNDIDLICAFKFKLIGKPLLDKCENKARGRELIDLQDLKKKLNKKTYDEQLTKKQRKLFKRGRRLFRVNELSNRKLMQAVRYHLINNSFFSKKMNYQEPYRACTVKRILEEIKKCENNEVRRYLFLSRSRVPDTLLTKRDIYVIKGYFVRNRISWRRVKKKKTSARNDKSDSSKNTRLMSMRECNLICVNACR